MEEDVQSKVKISTEPNDFVNMVCGFAFEPSPTSIHPQVLLMRKNRGPQVVRGRWNGPGGKVEGDGLDETLEQAMVREFAEETGGQTSVTDWERFVEFRFDGGCVHFFFYNGPPLLPAGVRTGAESPTDEELRWIDVDAMPGQPLGAQVVPNLLWLIPLALDLMRSPMKLPIVVEDQPR
jgi:8-oxo-dGTP pyrophosphatase MutT (NUDIX family)